MRVFANTGENIQNFASVRPGVLHTVCSDERQSMRARQIDQFSINAFFTANEMALKLDKNIFATEDVDQKPSAVCGTVGSARLQRAGFGILPKRTSLERRFTSHIDSKKSSRMQNASASTLQACAPQKRHQALCELQYFIPLHCAFAFFAAQMRLGQQFAQVFIPSAIFHQHWKNAAVFH